MADQDYKHGGLRKKYRIEKADGTPTDPDAEYFVLRIDADPHARAALRTYATSVAPDNEVLATALLSWLEQGSSMIQDAKHPRGVLADTDGLNVLAQVCRSINRDNGWEQLDPANWDESEYKVPAMLALVTSEVSEAIEAFRNDDKENFGEELADIIIRVLDLAAGLGFNMERQITRKLGKNIARSHRHGGKRL